MKSPAQIEMRRRLTMMIVRAFATAYNLLERMETEA
jgi:hypothetical protein